MYMEEIIDGVKVPVVNKISKGFSNILKMN